MLIIDDDVEGKKKACFFYWECYDDQDGHDESDNDRRNIEQLGLIAHRGAKVD